eukprot:sb/3467930/
MSILGTELSEHWPDPIIISLTSARSPAQVVDNVWPLLEGYFCTGDRSWVNKISDPTWSLMTHFLPLVFCSNGLPEHAWATLATGLNNFLENINETAKIHRDNFGCCVGIAFQGMLRESLCSVELLETNLVGLRNDICAEGNDSVMFCRFFERLYEFFEKNRGKFEAAREANDKFCNKNLKSSKFIMKRDNLKRGSPVDNYSEDILHLSKRQYDLTTTLAAFQGFLCHSSLPQAWANKAYEMNNPGEFYKQMYVRQYRVWLEFFCCLGGEFYVKRCNKS